MENKLIELEARIINLETKIKLQQEWIELAQNFMDNQAAINKLLREFQE